MKKAIHNFYSIILLLIMHINAIFGGFLLNSSPVNLYNHLLPHLINNEYKTLIIKSNGIIENNCDEFIGHYCDNLILDIDDTKYDCTLVKTEQNKTEAIYNEFLVYSSNIDSTQTTWNKLVGNGVYIGRDIAISICNNRGIKNISELINKQILINSNVFIINGIYFSNTLSHQKIDMESKGTYFNLSMKNPIFISKYYDIEAFRFKNFLYLNSKTSNPGNKYMEFKNRCLKKGLDTKIDEIRENNIAVNANMAISKIDKYCKSKIHVIIGIILILTSFIIDIFVFIKYKKHKTLGNIKYDRVQKILFFALPLLVITIFSLINFKLVGIYKMPFMNHTAIEVFSIFYLINSISYVFISRKNNISFGNDELEI